MRIPVFLFGCLSIVDAQTHRIIVSQFFSLKRTKVCTIVTRRVLRHDAILLIVCYLLKYVIFLIFLHFFCLKIFNFAPSIISEN